MALVIVVPFLTVTASACGPAAPPAVTSTATLLPPEVRYATPTNTPTITLTPSYTPMATITPTASQTSTPTTTTTFTATTTPTLTPTDTPTYTPTPFPTRVPGATFTPVPTFSSNLPAPHLWLNRPIPDGYQDYVEPTYRYGSTQSGSLRPHHGTDFTNPAGTLVIAAAGGQVTYADSDSGTVLGPIPDFYGNVVVVKLHESYRHQPVYNLYGHLATIAVTTGQFVATGDPLGTVGGTGVANGGAHLHLEVRVGYDDYFASRNPELWLRPYQGWGALAGRVTDNDGHLVPMANTTIRSIKLDDEELDPVHRYLITYVNETVNPDDELGENFALTDLPPGVYSVSVNNSRSTRNQTVVIKAGQLSWVKFANISPPATRTPTPGCTPDTCG